MFTLILKLKEIIALCQSFYFPDTVGIWGKIHQG